MIAVATGAAVLAVAVGLALVLWALDRLFAAVEQLEPDDLERLMADPEKEREGD